MANQQEQRLTEDCSAVLSQLAAYFANVLDERSFADLLSNMTHLRIDLHEAHTVPPQVRDVLRAARLGLVRAAQAMRPV
jgi:hypothetical protein